MKFLIACMKSKIKLLWRKNKIFMNGIFQNLKLFFRIIVLVKWRLTKPNQSNILIYDDESIEDLDFYLKNKKYEIFYNRYEQINLYVILYTIFVNGIKNIKKNYKFNFFKMVSPKVVITLIDENPGFFKLKNLYPQAKYISVQIAFKGKNFYSYIKSFKKKNKKFKFKSDISFVLGKNDRDKYKRYLDTKIITLGGIKNNNFPIKKKKFKKIKKILFISGALPNNKDEKINSKGSRSVKIFKYLEKYCIANKIKLFLLSKYKGNTLPKYREYYGNGNWVFVPNVSTRNTYKIINDSQFVVFENSTLGYEAFSKNIKGVCFPKVFPHEDYSKMSKKKEGFFWSTKISRKILFSKISKVIRHNQKKWENIISKEIRNILIYSPRNIIFSKTINKFIKNEIL